MDLISLELSQQRIGADVGECPKCRPEGRSGRLKIIEVADASSESSYGFAGCDAGDQSSQVCDYRALVQDVKPPKTECPECGRSMRPVRRRDGGHCLVCEKDGWFLADQLWRVVQSPSCPECRKPMVHRERSGRRGSFFWACFEHRAFVEADVFGATNTEERSR
jgi:hypothetical protein